MVEKKQYYKGIEISELIGMGLNEFMKIVPSRARRTLKRGLSDIQKKLLKTIKEKKDNPKAIIRTRCRNLVILPEMIGSIVHVHNGKEYIPVHITFEKVGRFLGEFVMTRKALKHSAPGVGATKSTASASVK